MYMLAQLLKLLTSMVRDDHHTTPNAESIAQPGQGASQAAEDCADTDGQWTLA